ncbi:hypothetical protein G7046_g5529 [Stylonectria norvegica]|nr:hypothetical protein G7046_g5529 [Stylonectria norvegica]
MRPLGIGRVPRTFPTPSTRTCNQYSYRFSGISGFIWVTGSASSGEVSFSLGLFSSPADSVAFSSSSFLYFLRLFLLALAVFFLFTSPTIADRLCSPFRWSSIALAISSRAYLRFWSRDRVAWHLTTMPVGTCLSCTAELHLFCGGR